MDQVYVKDLGQHVGEEVTVKGWLYNKRSSGKVRFLLVRDGTGLVQCVLVAGDLAEETFEIFDAVTQESSLEVTGVVREDARSPGGYEIQLKDLLVIQLTEDYPISPKEHGITFLLDHRHLWLRSSRPHRVMRVRDRIRDPIREFFRERDCIRIYTPIPTGAVGDRACTLVEAG